MIQCESFLAAVEPVENKKTNSQNTKRQGRFGLSRFSLSLPAWWESGGFGNSTRDSPKRPFLLEVKNMQKLEPGASVASSQCGKILAHLQSGKALTPTDALRLFGCFRLAARINDLRELGHQIQSEIIGVTNAEGRKVRVARYSMTGIAGRGADA